MDALLLEAAEELRPLAGQVEELRSDTDSVRFAIALLRLHNLAAGFFANQVLDGADSLEANDAVGSLRELVAALSGESVSLSQRLGLFRARAVWVSKRRITRICRCWSTVRGRSGRNRRWLPPWIRRSAIRCCGKIGRAHV